MPVEITDRGHNNQVDLHPWLEAHGKLRVILTGDNAHISIPAKPLTCFGMHIELGSDSSVDVGAGCGLTNTYIFCARQGRVKIGDGTTLHAKVRFVLHEPSRIILGRDCMVASDVQFLTSDNHSILDATTGRRINPAQDIEIGDHVWLGLQSVIMKGTRIGAGSVVGLRSVVTGAVPANCLATGSPARVIRENVQWDRKLLPEVSGPAG